ncbi:MAG: hypothetical protein V3V05_03410 [Pontiella sp.]
MVRFLVVSVLILACASIGNAEVIFRDHFDNGNLATAPASTNVAGGFYEVDNGQNKDGFSEEVNGNTRLI